jgi:type IV pilus assembly protein PilC
MEAVLQSFGKDLPLFTKLVVGVVNALVYLPFVLLILFPLLKGKLKDYPELVGRYLLKTPVVGKIVLYINLARFAAVMAMLLKAATPLNEALKMAVSGIGNAYLKKRLEELIPEVERGKSLSGLLSRIEILPPLFVNLVATGEESGELERAFDTLASLYEKETYRTIDFWVSMVEPLTIVLIAAVVGIIIVSVMLPLAEITTGQFLK